MNITGEESKHGFRKEDVLPFIQELADLDKIQIVGLMTMAPLGQVKKYYMQHLEN